MSRLFPSVSHFEPLFRLLSAGSRYKSHGVFMKTSALADFETFILSRYETTLLTLWHSRRGQGAAVRARNSPITWACKYFTCPIGDLHIALRAVRLCCRLCCLKRLLHKRVDVWRLCNIAAHRRDQAIRLRWNIAESLCRSWKVCTDNIMAEKCARCSYRIQTLQPIFNRILSIPLLSKCSYLFVNK